MHIWAALTELSGLLKKKLKKRHAMGRGNVGMDIDGVEGRK